MSNLLPKEPQMLEGANFFLFFFLNFFLSLIAHELLQLCFISILQNLPRYEQIGRGEQNLPKMGLRQSRTNPHDIPVWEPCHEGLGVSRTIALKS